MPEDIREIIGLLPTCVEPLGESIAADFERYCWRVVELRRHSLIDFGRSSQTVEWDERLRFPPLTADESIEAFESLCLRFRRLDALTDPAGFPDVRGKLAGWLKQSKAPDAEQVMQWLSDLKKRRKRLLGAWAPGQTIFAVHDDGTRTPIAPKDAIDLVFNGEMFHANRGKPAALEALGAWQIIIVPAIYHQIAELSNLYEKLAFGVASILNEPSLVPAGFEPFLRVRPAEAILGTGASSGG